MEKKLETEKALEERSTLLSITAINDFDEIDIARYFYELRAFASEKVVLKKIYYYNNIIKYFFIYFKI